MDNLERLPMTYQRIQKKSFTLQDSDVKNTMHRIINCMHVSVVWFIFTEKVTEEKMRVSLLPDYYDLFFFGIHHLGMSSVCYGKQMPEGERDTQQAFRLLKEAQQSILLPSFCTLILCCCSCQHGWNILNNLTFIVLFFKYKVHGSTILEWK